jgi:uncharacterized protein YhaN
MKKTIIAGFLGLLFLTTHVSGQQNTDSLSIIAKISEYQLKLAKLENNVNGAIRDKQDAADKAQISANTNITAANSLSDHPEDKKLAKDASDKASDAKADAKKGRKESDKLDKLRKDIRDVKGKIADEQAKLNRFTHGSLVNSGVPQTPVQADTTNHN